MAAQLFMDAPSPDGAIAVAPVKTDQPLPFEIELVSGVRVGTIGEAQRQLLRFEKESIPKSHWMLAIRMFRKAADEPEWLKLATMSLETAFALEHVLAGPRVSRTCGPADLVPDSLSQGASKICVDPTALLGRLLEVLDEGEAERRPGSSRDRGAGPAPVAG